MNWNALAPIGLLAGSNLVMNLAWYGHLKAPSRALWLAVLASWGIAFFEYCLAVPANRIGYGYYSAAQLKTIQEVMTLVVFVGFSSLYLKESISWTTLLGFVFIGIGATLVFRG